jgi:dipeptidyl aminopeptidase/acylaminoacyl peptidase
MELTFTRRLSPFPRLGWAIVVLAILVLAVAALLAAGVGQRRLPHFGEAANGQMAFVDGSSLKVATAAGSNVHVTAELGSPIESLTFSPDGTRLAYRTTGSVPSLVVASANGSDPVVVVSGADLGTGEPIAWSPDSRRLAFTRLLGAGSIGTIDIVDADGSHRRQVIEGSAAEATDRFAPAWSPDGQWISFFSTESNDYRALNVIHPDGSGAQRLSTSPMNPDIIDMSWSPDPSQSRVVYVAGGNVDLFDLLTAKETTVGSGFWPTWSPDGGRIAWWGEQSQAVKVADLLAGNPRPVGLFPSYGSGYCQDHPEAAGKSSCGPARWSPDGVWVYAPDVVGKAILIARSDGSGDVRSITLDHPIDVANAAVGVLDWQAIAP